MTAAEINALKLRGKIKLRNTTYTATVALFTENYVRLEWAGTAGPHYDVINKTSPLWLSLELKK